MALNKNFDFFLIYVPVLKIPEMTIYFRKIAQITSDNLILVATLESNKTFTKISAKYANYSDVFLFDLAIELSENSSINKYTIKLEKEK